MTKNPIFVSNSIFIVPIQYFVLAPSFEVLIVSLQSIFLKNVHTKFVFDLNILKNIAESVTVSYLFNIEMFI